MVSEIVRNSGTCVVLAVFNKILKWVAASLKRSEFGQFSEFVFSGPHQKVENLVQNAKILVIFPRYFIKNIAGDRRVQMFLITRYQRYLAGKLLKLFLRHLLNSAKLSWPLKRSSTSAHVGPVVCERPAASAGGNVVRDAAPGPERRRQGPGDGGVARHRAALRLLCDRTPHIAPVRRFAASLVVRDTAPGAVSRARAGAGEGGVARLVFPLHSAASALRRRT